MGRDKQTASNTGITGMATTGRLESLRKLERAQEQAERRTGRYIKAQLIKSMRKYGMDAATIRTMTACHCGWWV